MFQRVKEITTQTREAMTRKEAEAIRSMNHRIDLNNAKFTSLMRKAQALGLDTSELKSIAKTGYYYELYFPTKKQHQIFSTLSVHDGRTISSFLSNAKKKNDKYTIDNLAMGSGGVGQIQVVTCGSGIQIRVQLTCGKGKYNYADCAVLWLA